MASHRSFARLKRDAKDWLKELRQGDAQALVRLRRALPAREGADASLHLVQLALARELGYAGWSELKREREAPVRGGDDKGDLDRRIVELATLHYGVRPGDDHHSDYEDGPTRWRQAAWLLDLHPQLGESSFLGAVVSGNLAAVERWLERDPRLVLDRSGPHGREPLLQLACARLPAAAAIENCVAVTELLLERGADPNAAWLVHPNPKSFAFDRHPRHYRPLDALMGYGTLGPRALPPHPRGLELAEQLLEHGASPLAIEGLYATFAGPDDDRWLRLLIRHGLDRDAIIPWLPPENASLFNCLLGNAGVHNLPRMAAVLLEHGADPNSIWVMNTWDRINQHRNAASSGNPEVAELLLRYGAETQPLHPFETFQLALLSDDETRHKELFLDTSDFHANAGIMMVWTAASQDDVRLTQRLLGLGVPVNFEVDEGFCAMHNAAAWNATAVLALLIQRGAELDARDHVHNATPLAWALHHAAWDAATLLAARSEDVFSLCRGGFVERVEQLAEQQPEMLRQRVVAPTGFGDRLEAGATPLFALPLDEGEALEIARCLLRAGVDPAATDAHRVTAAARAIQRGQRSLAERLARSPSA